MGNLFKSSSKATKAPFEQSPWQPQQGYLTEGFAAAKSAMDNAMADNGAISDYTADLTSDQLADLQRMRERSKYATGVGNAAIGVGQGALGNFGVAAGNAQGIYDAASRNPTDGIISDAAKYADNPYLSGQIDSVLRDVGRNLDIERGNINTAATGTGNINSSRTGTLDAYATKDAADRAADISATMRGDAYNQGLGMASDNHWNQLESMLRANGMLADTGAQGFDLASAGYDLGAKGDADAYATGQTIQNQNQAEIEGRLLKMGMPQDIVKQYMAAVGANYGSQGFQSQITESASPFQQLMGAAAMAGGMGFRPFGGA